MTQQTPAIFSNNGLASYGEASPGYELAPLGIASMQGQAQKLAEFGRNGDIYVIHAAEGETVIPMEVLAANPQIKALLFNQMAEMGLDPQSYIVGDQLNSINPVTGMPEFFFKSIFKGIKKAVKKVVKIAKKIAPVALPIIMSFTGFPAALGFGAAFGPGTIGAAALSSGIGSLIGGGSLKDAFKSALISGGTAGIMGGLKGWAGAPEGTSFSGFGAGVKSALTGQTPIYNAAGKLIGTQAPPTLGEQWDNLWESGVKGGRGEFTPTKGYIPPTAPTGPGGPTLPSDWYINPATNIPYGAQKYVPSVTGGNILGGAETVSVVPSPQKYINPFTNERVQNVAELLQLQEAGILPVGPELAVKATAAAADPGPFLDSLSPSSYFLPEGSNLMDAALIGGSLYAGGAFDTAEEESLAETRAQALAALDSTPIDQEAAQQAQIDISTPGVTQGVYTPPSPVLVSDYEDLLVQRGAHGGSVSYPERDLLVEGPGTEKSDDIPAMLSDGEFVINSRAVRGADPSGGGDRYAGAQNLYNIMRNFEMRA